MSNSRKIRTCFIAQDQREHIINGLSVYQTLLYASKLKNVGYTVDHEFNIKHLMNELSILDIKNKTVHKCSAGQQKRVVMAMELTAKVKPSLICVDEPTSGVDSYSALLMIKCFTNIQSQSRPVDHHIHTSAESRDYYALRHALCVGQRRSHCLQWSTTALRRHLNECQIFLNDNQIAIEVLLKIGAKGHQDPQVLDLFSKTNAILDQYDTRIETELTHYPNGIPVRNKKFSWQQFYHLLCRTVIFILKYQWITIVGLNVILIAIAFVCRLMFKRQRA